LLLRRIYSIGQFCRAAFCLTKKANEGREWRINTLNGSFLALTEAGQWGPSQEREPGWQLKGSRTCKEAEHDF